MFPGAHLFCADIWNDQGRIDLGPGVYWNQIPTWSNGAAPGPFTGQGPPCGPLDWWQHGVPSDAPPLSLDGRGFPLCCHVPVEQESAGGIKLGGGRLTCQPWRPFLPGSGRSITRLLTGTVWTTGTNTTIAYSASDPLAPTKFIAAAAVGTCFGFDGTTFTLKQGTNLTSLALQSWDPATNRGIWRVPAVSGIGYANEYFAFRSPLT